MAETAIAKPKKQRNYAVDFWRFFATLAVFWGHYQLNYRFTFMQDHSWNAEGILFTEGNILGVFLIFTGFFMMKSYEGKKRRGLTNKPARTQAVDYLKTRYLGLWPALFLGVVIGFVVNVFAEYDGHSMGNLIYTNGESFGGIADVMYNLLSSILQFAGLDATGILGQLGISFAWNIPLWYISAIFVGGYFLYYLLAKNEDIFTGFIAPFIVVSFAAVWCLNEGLEMNDRRVLFCGIVENALAFGVWGMCIGVVCYKPYERLRTMVLTNKGKTILTIVHLFFFCTLVYWEVVGNTWRGTAEMFIDIWAVITCAFAIANQDYLTSKVLNHKIFSTLGEYSLYFFICHMPVLELFNKYYPMVPTANDYYSSLAIAFAITAVAGLVAMFICKKGIQPLLYKLDANIQAATKRGEEERAAAAQKAA